MYSGNSKNKITRKTCKHNEIRKPVNNDVKLYMIKPGLKSAYADCCVHLFSYDQSILVTVEFNRIH